MSKPFACLTALLLSFTLAGCLGPMTMPMIQRLEEKQQTRVDTVWQRATTPRDRLARQSLLDVIVLGQLFQVGVDKAAYRAEKKIDAGTVVMEVSFDRAKPDADRFEVSLLDADAKVVRRERYTRDDVEQTIRDLYEQPRVVGVDADGQPRVQQVDANGQPLPEPPEVAAWREKMQERLQLLEDVLKEDVPATK